MPSYSQDEAQVHNLTDQQFYIDIAISCPELSFRVLPPMVAGCSCFGEDCGHCCHLRARLLLTVHRRVDNRGEV
ncbi:hypothetical protein LIER_31708 [Lithospermum erythrorhizon]|uniref:Uncharacterized protein n=1 Tax=Lithospermum erythrorhizon TaxID=34254 RepID=A0AAV3RU62_LITER